jgi:hypothetical protein
MNCMTTLYLLLSIYFSQPVATPPEKNPGNNAAVSTEQTEASKGYWVIQQIAGITDKVVVLFYNEKNELVKKEWRSIEQADINKHKVVRSLKRSLNEALKMQSDDYWN